MDCKSLRKFLFTEEILNDQFTRLEELDKDGDSSFVYTMTNTYLGESLKHIDAIEQALNAIPLDEAKVDQCLENFKGGSTTFGANKVTIEVIKMLNCCKRGDMEGCKAGIPSLKQECDTLKNKMEEYMKLLINKTSRTCQALVAPSENVVSKNE